MSVSSVKTGAIGDSLLVGNTPFNPSSYESIATVTVGAGGASTISFSSIPSTYQHLQIRGISNSGDASYIAAQFNADTGSNYSNHAIYGDDSGTLVAQATAPATNFFVSRSNYSAGNIFGTGICDILDYTNTNKYTTTRTLAGNDSNGTAGGVVFVSSGSWRNTAAVTSILIYPTSGSFRQYSSFALYGIKG